MMQKNLGATLEQIAAVPALKIAVVGDVMLDRYISGSVSRISPEAPIPILNYESERSVLGGAGNVVANLCGLGANVCFVARVGEDEAGTAVEKLLWDKNASSVGGVSFCPVKDGVTTVKTRIVGNGRHQILRLDREEKPPLTLEQVQHVLALLQRHISEGLAAVILSDYAKGVCGGKLCKGVVEACGLHGVPVFVDPKGADWQRYAGAELVTPNIKELSEALGRVVPNDDEAVIAAARELRDRFSVKNILVTRSEKGSTFVGMTGIFHTPSRAVEVFDVSGAGDTVIATASYFRAQGMGWETCCELANVAAQVVIAKAGTYAISFSELRDAVICNSGERSFYQAPAKVFTLAELEQMRRRWRSAGETVVFTNGCFDVFHAGHVDSLQRARKLGHHLIVGLNSDRSVRRLKGMNRPINSENERARVLAALECVDAVTIFDEDTPERLLSVLRPDILVKGGDYRVDQVAGRQFARQVVILPLVEGMSSTRIIEKMNGKD